MKEYRKKVEELNKKRANRKAGKNYLASEAMTEEDIEVPQKPYPAYCKSFRFTIFPFRNLILPNILTSAFLSVLIIVQFANSKRQEIKDANPGATNGEISKMLSAIWKGSSDDFKEPYFKEEMEQRANYKIQMEAYRKKVDKIYQNRAEQQENDNPDKDLVSEPQEVNTDDIVPPQKPYPAYL